MSQAKVVCIADFRKPASAGERCRQCGEAAPVDWKPLAGVFYLCQPCIKAIGKKLDRGEGVTLRAM